VYPLGYIFVNDGGSLFKFASLIFWNIFNLKDQDDMILDKLFKHLLAIPFKTTESTKSAANHGTVKK
jgi:hypothetical protein